MDFYEVIRNRRSIRGYEPDPVPEAALERIKEAVRLAPSACNRQPWHFLVISDTEMREKIYQCYPSAWVKSAPLIVVACGNPESAWHRLEGNSAVDIDLGIAMEHLVLAATAEGLGTCWICAFDVNKMTETVGVEEPWRALAITPLGYPKEAPRALQRKEMSEIFPAVEP